MSALYVCVRSVGQFVFLHFHHVGNAVRLSWAHEISRTLRPQVHVANCLRKRWRYVHTVCLCASQRVCASFALRVL